MQKVELKFDNFKSFIADNLYVKHSHLFAEHDISCRDFLVLFRAKFRGKEPMDILLECLNHADISPDEFFEYNVAFREKLLRYLKYFEMIASL